MTLEQLQALYDEWKQSGERQELFLKRRQLDSSTFSNAYYLLNTGSRKHKKHEDPLRMLPVDLQGQSHEVLPALTDMTLEFSNGACLRFSVGTSIAYLTQLVDAVQARQAC